MRLYITITIALLALVGCSFGIIHITHKDGELPKVHVETPSEDCKLKVRKKDGGTIKYDCEWEFLIYVQELHCIAFGYYIV